MKNRNANDLGIRLAWATSVLYDIIKEMDESIIGYIAVPESFIDSEIWKLMSEEERDKYAKYNLDLSKKTYGLTIFVVINQECIDIPFYYVLDAEELDKFEYNKSHWKEKFRDNIKIAKDYYKKKKNVL